MDQALAQPNDQLGLFIGIDWADEKHDCCVIDRQGKTIRGTCGRRERERRKESKN